MFKRAFMCAMTVLTVSTLGACGSDSASTSLTEGTTASDTANGGEDTTNSGTAGTGTTATRCDGSIDTDDDGLSDCDERELHRTSPVLADTDGDGISDSDELLDFDPQTNRYKFNPLIADVPRIRFEMTSLMLGLNHTEGESTEEILSVEHTVERADTSTTSESNTNATSVEQTHEVGASVTVGYEWGPTGGASAEGTVSYNYSHSTTHETSVTWTEEQSEENREAFAEGRSMAQANGTDNLGGNLSTTVTIFNDGNRAFTVNSLVLSAVFFDPTTFPSIKPLGNLSIDSPQSNFPAFSIPPGESRANVNFVNGALSLEVIRDAMSNSSGLTLGVATYELTDARGRSYAHDMTAIGARDANIIIDYAGARPTESYLVATTGDPDTRSIAADSALRDILDIPYVATEGVLSDVRGVTNGDNAEWLVLHIRNTGVAFEVAEYGSDAPFELDAIELRAGDILHLIHLEDADDDGLGAREEAFLGTNPNNPDTDDDGLEDGDEVRGVAITVMGRSGEASTFEINSDGRIADTDDDGLDDAQERAQGTNPNSPDTDGDRMNDAVDIDPVVFNNLDVTNLQASADLAEPFALSSVTLSWTPAVLSQPSGTIIARQVSSNGNFVAIAPISSISSLGEHLLCADGSYCYEVVHAGGNSMIDRNLEEGTVVRYLPITYVESANAFVPSSQHIDQSLAVPTASVNFTLEGIYMDTCLDGLNGRSGMLSAPDDFKCEVYWTTVEHTTGIVDALSSEKIAAKSVNTGDTIAINAQHTIEVPLVEGACRHITIMVNEKENSNDFSTRGDLSTHALYHSICYSRGALIGLGDYSSQTASYDEAVGSVWSSLATRASVYISVTQR